MTPNAPIGILDSGVGGLSVWREISILLPQEQTIYIADSCNAPYGGRSNDEIFLLASRLIDFLLTKDVKIIVAACNTITVSCIDRLREKYREIEIVGTVPAIKSAVRVSQRKRIGILTTERTAKSDYQQKLIDSFASNCHVVTVGTNKLVPLIEEGDRHQVKHILPGILTPFTEGKIDTLVLGCTHYPLIKEEIAMEMGKGVVLLDSGEAIAKRTRDILKKRCLLAKEKVNDNQFFTTGSVEKCNFVLEQVDKMTE